MVRRTALQAQLLALAVIAALGVAAPAQAVSVYHLRPAQLDPLVWLGVKPGTSYAALTVPTPGMTDWQDWVFVRTGGTTFQPSMAMKPYQSQGVCLDVRPPPNNQTFTVGQCGGNEWQVRDPQSRQVRAPGLLASGSRVLVVNFYKQSQHCLGFYGVPIVGGTVRPLPCTGGINQQWTLTRFTLP